jgi:hypothetical protein
MTQNQMLTWGAIGFAAFAAYTIWQAKRPSGGPATATDLAGLMSQHDVQSGWNDTSAQASLNQLSNLLGTDPFSTAPTAGFTVPDLITAG